MFVDAVDPYTAVMEEARRTRSAPRLRSQEERRWLAEHYARRHRADPGTYLTRHGNRVTAATRSEFHQDAARRTLFYLGTHRPYWLTYVDAPALFISLNTIGAWRSRGDRFPTRRAATFGRGMWAMDSGGFTELSNHGEWRLSADDFGSKVTQVVEDVGAMPKFVSPQDWMCEPVVLSGGRFKNQTFAGTGLTVRQHQAFTVENFLYLRQNFPFIPWLPVLQGYHEEEYIECEEMYAAAGVDLVAEPIVGLGSVCRRDGTAEAARIVDRFWRKGVKLHGFGMKTTGLELYGHKLASSDSLAWSDTARKEKIRLPECEHEAATCGGCFRYAMHWRERVLDRLRVDRPSEQESIDVYALGARRQRVSA